MPLNIEYYYLLSGYIKMSSNGKGFGPVDEGLDLVPNRVVISKDLRVEGENKPYVYITNTNGVLHHIQPPFKLYGAMRYLSKSQNFFLIPPDIVQQAFTLYGRTWKQSISKIVAKSNVEGISLIKKKVYKRHFRKPDYTSEEKIEKQYKSWYDRLGENEPVYGFIIGKIRALNLQVNRSELEDALVNVKAFNQKNEHVNTFIDIAITNINVDLGIEEVSSKVSKLQATIFGRPEDLPNGIYEFTVKPRELFSIERWSKPLTNENASYTFKEKVRFNITNPVGEFDIIQCDPISVEEALLQQFPVQYAHHTHAAKKKYASPKEDKKQPLPKALEVWGNRMAWTYDKAKMSVDLINENSQFNRSMILGKSVWTALFPKKDESDLKYIQQCVDLVFHVNQIRQDWTKLSSTLSTRTEMAHVKELVWEKIPKHFARNKWWNDIVDVAAGKKETRLLLLEKVADMADDEMDELLKFVATEKQTRLQKMAGTMGKKAETSLLLAGTALSAYQAGVHINQVLGIKEELKKNIRSLDRLLDEYEALKVPSREGMQTLERYRLATVQGSLNFSKKMAETAMKVLDLTLGILCMIPVTAAAAQTIVLVKTLVETGTEVVISISKTLDDLITDGYLGAILEKEKKTNEILNASFANMRLMPTGRTEPTRPSERLNCQLRLRSEALYGLAALLTRAGYVKREADSPKDAETVFLEKIEKYKVKDYMRYFILNDGWQLPGSFAVPMTMYTYWMFVSNSHNSYRSYGSFAKSYGTHEVPFPGDPNVPSPGMFMMGNLSKERRSNHLRADFQRLFPIHTMDAENINEFATAFKTTFDELDEDCLEYSGIYYREPGVTNQDVLDKGMKDLGWQLINPENDTDIKKLKSLSPLHPIRVVVILKPETLPAPYPISLQLIKEEWVFKVKGPRYKDIVRFIDDELLESEKTWLKKRDKMVKDTDEKDSPQWLGCVFYPFYQFLDGVYAGTKPTMKEGSRITHYRLDTSFLEYDKSEVPEVWQAYFESVYEQLEKGHEQTERVFREHLIRKEFTDSRFGFDIKIGSPRTCQRLSLGSKEGAKSELKTYRVTLDPNDDKQKLFLNDDFLESNNTKISYPGLFMRGPVKNVVADHGLGPCWIRVGSSGEFVLPEKGAFTDENFNWNTPVEFIVMVWASHLEEKDYAHIGVDWKTLALGVEMDLYNTVGFGDTAGPTFFSTLHYVGELSKSGFGATFNKTPVASPPEILDPVLHVLENEASEQSKKWCREILYATTTSLKSQFGISSWHLFAAHFKMRYITPETKTHSGLPVESIRPFGEIDDGFFEYVIRNIRTKNSVGLNEQKLKYPGGLFMSREYTFQFPAPENHRNIPHFSYISDADYNRWLTEQSRAKAPDFERLFK